VNRLETETSPYLRQHSNNPVDWYPWGNDAFAAARESGKPIFLSIGYSACHWCHVMAHESFEDQATADVMNHLFVNVKVDREERPDVDAIYMEATQAMTGHGGWPMSVWLTADGRPFYTGTYFPPTDRAGAPSFTRLCEAIAEAWNERRDEVEQQAEHLTGSIGRRLPVVETAVGRGVFVAAREGLREQFDARWGGFGRAPKFPPAQTLTFLARQQVRDPSAETLEMLSTTLAAMTAGGMYDQIGGGFARYSVDQFWLIPHFEKMLYDNALLTRAYTIGWQVDPQPRYARVVEETIDYVIRDLRHELGGFFSAEDADSEGVEGKFYAWSIDEVREVCGTDADHVIEFFGITAQGNFVDPHTSFSGNVLRLVDRHAEPDTTIRRARGQLFERRSTRVRPGLDDKVLTAWNALMARALADAAWVFDRPEWLAAARANIEFVWANLRRADGRLMRSWQSDVDDARHLGYCEDYAALLEAIVTLAEYDDVSWLDRARIVADSMLELFSDPDGGFFTTGDDAERLIVRPQDFMDNATPSENSMAAVGLTRLATLTGDDRYSAAARATIARCAPLIGRAPSAFGYAVEAVERQLEAPIEIAIIGAATDPARHALERVVAARLIPSSVVLRSETGAIGSPLLEGRTLVDNAASAYVCERFACQMPTTDPERLGEQIDQAVSARR
jgi:uncharacterized protein YyaL (SSP411 family)